MREIYPTQKQENRFKKIIDYLGNESVENYFYKVYPRGDYNNMTRNQMQKMITGLDSKMPSKPISTYGFYGQEG